MKYCIALIILGIDLVIPFNCIAAGSGSEPSNNQPQPTPSYSGSFGFEQSTSFYGNSSGACGVQAYTDLGQGSNPQAETSWRVGMVLNSQKCIDQNKLEQSRLETNKYQADVQQNIACITARTDLIKNNHNPDHACIIK
jgi:hypothetical protein